MNRTNQNNSIDSPGSIPSEIDIFINGLSWVFIIFMGGATFILSIHLIFLFNFPIKESLTQLDQKIIEGFPTYAQFAINNMKSLISSAVFISFISTLSAIYLFKRKKWAFYYFQGLLVFQIIGNIIGLFLIFNYPMELDKVDLKIDESTILGFSAFYRGLKYIGLVMGIGLISLMVWVLRKLRSVANQFH